MVKINMGCGRRDFGKEWIHIDGGDYSHLDSNNMLDLSQEDDSVDLIYASHVIEYFDRDEIKSLLKEWVRVLKPNGILRLAVPDFKEIALLYTKGQLSLGALPSESDRPLEKFLGPLYGKMQMQDKTIYHKTVYDFHSLKSVLENLGMNNIKKYDWRETEHSEFDDHSQAYIPHMDKENGTLISLNMECTK